MPKEIKTPAKTKKTAQNKFNKLIKKLKDKKAVHYSMSQSFKKDDLIDHDTFGKGIVIDIHNKKIDVLFSDQIRILVCDRKNF